MITALRAAMPAALRDDGFAAATLFAACRAACHAARLRCFCCHYATLLLLIRHYYVIDFALHAMTCAITPLLRHCYATLLFSPPYADDTAMPAPCYATLMIAAIHYYFLPRARHADGLLRHAAIPDATPFRHIDIAIAD